MSVYTVGLWRVKRGQEQAFVAAWSNMARRTADDFPGAQAVLLRDPDVPGLFISSGSWSSIEDIETWRGSATFQEGVSPGFGRAWSVGGARKLNTFGGEK